MNKPIFLTSDSHWNMPEMILPPTDWHMDAACTQERTGLSEAQLDKLFFCGPGNHDSRRRACSICAGCPVKDQCLEYALAVPAMYDYGIWAGTTRLKRRLLRRCES